MKSIAFSIIALVAAVQPSAQTCPLFNESTPKNRFVEYLRANKQSPVEEWNIPCVTSAIANLSHKPAADAAAVLVDYLDFRRPLTDSEQHGYFSRNPDDIANNFPAAATLFTFGDIARQPLLTAIRDSESSTIRRNATYTLMSISRDEPQEAIQMLREEATHAAGVQADHLQSSIRESIKWCAPRKKSKCELAAKG